MKIHEFQAKNILKSFGVPIPKGRMAETTDAAVDVARSLGSKMYVVKAQVHAGGRGKAGGVKVVNNIEGVKEAASNILGMKLISKQTGPEGKLVSKILVEEVVDIKKEFYLGMLVDRETKKIVIMVSSEGGMEIEEVANKTPDKIVKEYVDLLTGLKSEQCHNLGTALGLSNDEIQKFEKVVSGCFEAFVKNDLTLVEINPLVLTKSGDVIALDAKIDVDDNALFRHKEISELRDLSEEDEREFEASKHQLNYISLNGSIGCLVNGAGLAMATMDIIKHYGATPANFLDVGGSATVETVTAGLKIILSDTNVKAILVNIFGGIIKCDVIAESVVAAAKEVGIKVPLVVRLQGTNCEMGRDILDKSKLSIISATTMDDAAEKVVSTLKV